MCLRRSPAFVAPSGLVADWTTSNWSWCCTTQNFPPDGRVCPAICDPPMRVALCAPRVALFLEHPDLPLGGPVCGCPGKRYGLPPACVLLPRTNGPTGLPAVSPRLACACAANAATREFDRSTVTLSGRNIDETGPGIASCRGEFVLVMVANITARSNTVGYGPLVGTFVRTAVV